MQKNKTIAIIGGGISGLSAGIYALKNGYDVTIYEMQPYVGGFCTGWYRQGRYVDGCLHWLTGTKEGTQLNRMWKDVGAFESQNDIIYNDSFGSFEHDGVVVTFYRDIEKAQKEWIEISKEDEKEIKHFFKMVRDFNSIEEPLHFAINMMPLKDIIKFGLDCLKIWPSYLKTMKLSCDEYAKKFKHPALQFAMKTVQPGDGNLFSMIYSYATITNNNGGIPKGGSKALAERIKNKYLNLGGKLKLCTKVRRVIIEKNVCKGIELESGEKIYSDYVISALDAKYAYYHLLDSKYLTKKFNNMIVNFKDNPCPSCCLVSLEVEDMIDIPSPFSFEVDPFDVGASIIKHLTVRSYAYDPDTYVKGNKTIVNLLIDQYGDDYNAWEKSYNFNKEAYKLEKEHLAIEVVNRIVKRFPELNGKIKVLDVATPVTMSRYTNATKGAYMSFLFTKRSPMNVEKGYITGLKNFYVAGQWVQAPGGLPLALVAGKFAVQRILKRDKLNFNLTPLRPAKSS